MTKRNWLRFAAIVVLASIPGFVIAYVAYRNERDERRTEAVEAATAISAAAEARYASIVEHTRIALVGLSIDDLDSPEPEGCPVDRILPSSDAYDEVLCALDDNDPWSRAALDTPGDVVYVSDGRSLVVALAFRPDAGRTIVVGVRLSLASLADLVAERAGDDAGLVVVDPDDTVIFATGEVAEPGTRVADAEIVRRIRAEPASDTVTARGIDGVRRVYSYRELDRSGRAIVFSGVSTGDALADTSDSLRNRAIALGLGVLVALAIGFAVAYFGITRRVRRLSTLTRTLGHGNLAARSNMRPDDDIGVLGYAIDTMASELQVRDEERSRLLEAVVAASEQERRRLASDVHDDSIQVMSAHVMGLQLLRRRVDDVEMQARIRELEDSGRAATARLRELVFELHSPILEDRGLGPAIEVLLERLFEGWDCVYTLSVETDDEPAPSVRDTAYRVAQEALRNARSHADAREVHVTVNRDGDELVLRVVDDGTGFEPGELDIEPGHLGLRAARERSAAVGGTFSVESEPGAGTTVECRLPWSL